MTRYIKGALFFAALIMLASIEGGWHAETLSIRQGIVLGGIGIGMLVEAAV